MPSVCLTSSDERLYQELKKPLAAANIQCVWSGDIIEALEYMVGKIMMRSPYAALIAETVVNGIHIREALKIMDYLTIQSPLIILVSNIADAPMLSPARQVQAHCISRRDPPRIIASTLVGILRTYAAEQY
jgi:hypothetical protein